MRNTRQFAIIGLTAVWLSICTAKAQTIHEWTGGTSSDWTVAGNWSSGSIGPTGGTYNVRLNVKGTRTLNYTSAQGATIYTPTADAPVYGRGLVIYGSASMAIQSGVFSTGGTAADIIGVTSGTDTTLTIAGGTYNSSGELSVGYGTAGNGIFTMSSGEATISTIQMVPGPSSSKNGTLNLNGGTLSVNNIYDVNGSGTTTVNLNGGTLSARQDNTAFISTNLNNLLVGNGGAKIDTAGFDVTIPKAITPDGVSTGGLTKSGAGTLTLSATNTYAGETIVNEGTLHLSGSVTNSNGVTINGTGALVLNNTAGDAIGDDKRLTIADGVTVQLDSGETVKELYIANRVKRLGTWGALGNVSADFKDSHFTGAGVLTVLTGQPPPDGTVFWFQ